MSEVIITGNAIKLVNGKIFRIRAIDARKLLINTSNAAYLEKETNEEGNITNVVIEGKVSIKLGDKIQIKVGEVDSVYEIQYIIISKGDKSIVLFSSLPTKTSTFLLPLLGKTKMTLKFDSYFVNAFLDNKHELLCLLYRFTGTQIYKNFEETMIKDAACVNHIDYDPYHVLYIFKIPENYKPDIENFLEGKYSAFSKGLRQKIWRFYGKEDGTAVLQIVRRDKELKEKMEELLNIRLSDESELASKPELEKEIYNIK
jgi:hypothetical protein